MGFEIDFLAVGTEGKSGDAIALRYGDLLAEPQRQRVIIIDGGFSEVGHQLVEHVNKYYGTERVDIVVSTHPDQDHVAGIQTVLEEMEVGELWMHLPWKHSPELAAGSRSFRRSHLSEILQKSLEQAEDLEGLARQRNIPILEPFYGRTSSDGCFRVLGPSVDYYEELLAEIEPQRALAAAIAALARKAVRMVEETLHHETLTDAGQTSPQNNSSTICLLECDGEKRLFTSDAGIPALDQAIGRLEAEGYHPGEVTFVQVPHHGSRRNVGPSVLGRLLGPAGSGGTGRSAFVSAAPKAGPKHPSKKVTNAFARRGYQVYATQGNRLRHAENAPNRPNWVPASALPFYEQVEHEEDET